LNILYVAPDVVVPFYRGASTHVLEVASGLAGQGDNVHLLSRRLDTSQSKMEILNGVVVHRIYRGVVRPLPGSKYAMTDSGDASTETALQAVYRGYLSTLFPLYAGAVSARLIKRYGIDVVLERETAFGAGALASEWGGVPMVLEVIGPRYSRKSVATAMKVLAYTSAMVRGVDSSKVIFVVAGVDSTRFTPDQNSGAMVRSRLGIDPAAPVIGYVGTFQPWHGLDTFLEALGALTEDIPRLRALLVGPYFGDVRDKAQSMGLSSTCLFTGPVPYEQTSSFINACDLMVAPYDPQKSKLRARRGIGFPIKVLEYMACGKPVVTSDLEPTNNVPDIAKAALLSPPGDSGAMADALRLLLQDREMASVMGSAGRATVERDYSWRQFACNLHQVLEEAARNVIA